MVDKHGTYVKIAMQKVIRFACQDSNLPVLNGQKLLYGVLCVIWRYSGFINELMILCRDVLNKFG